MMLMADLSNNETQWEESDFENVIKKYEDEQNELWSDLKKL